MNTLLDRHIEQSADTRGGQARVAGTRITVADIVIMHRRLRHSLEEVAGKYNLSPAAVYAAMAYYFDHQPEIERQIDDDDTFAEQSKKQNPSLLTEKLRKLGRG